MRHGIMVKMELSSRTPDVPCSSRADLTLCTNALGVSTRLHWSVARLTAACLFALNAAQAAPPLPF